MKLKQCNGCCLYIISTVISYMCSEIVTQQEEVKMRITHKTKVIYVGRDSDRVSGLLLDPSVKGHGASM